MSPWAREKVRPARDVVFRELEGELVLLSLKSGVYYGLNETGARMWALLQEEQEPARIVERLAQDYDASPRQLARDLQQLLAALRQHGFVERK